MRAEAFGLVIVRTVMSIILFISVVIAGCVLVVVRGMLTTGLRVWLRTVLMFLISMSCLVFLLCCGRSCVVIVRLGGL